MATVFDIHSLLAYSTIVSIQTQANNALVVTVQSGQGSRFSPNQQVILWPANPSAAPYFNFPSLDTAMVCRVTGISGDQITMDYSVGNREGSNTRTVLVGDQIMNPMTPKIFADIEQAINLAGSNSTTTGGGGTTTTTPPVTTPTPIQNPPASNPGTPPAPDPAVFTQGNSTFSSTTAALTDYDAGSPTSPGGGESVTVVTGGSNPFGSGSAFKFIVNNSTSDQVGVNKDLSLLNTRDFQFSFILDSAASLGNEETIFHAWTDKYNANLLEIRLKPASDGNSNHYNFLLRAPGTDNFATFVKSSNVSFVKGTAYDVELYMTDNSFSLLVGPTGGTKKLIIEWYNGVSLSNVYYAINNIGLDIGAVALGKFYSTSMSGIFYVKNTNFYQDYVPPTGPTTDAGKLADAWAGWKKRYLRSDGAIVRPNTEGQNGIYQAWSDVVSEGVAYGLILAVQMNDQVTFDLIEGWIEANLERTHNSLTAASLMGWHYDDVNNAMYDWNFATDADMDRVVALIWAAHRKTAGNAGWATSSLNYGAKATSVASDLKNYAFRTDSGTGYNYLSSDSFQLSADPMEINVSYHSVGAMKIIKNYTSDTFWDNAISGTYDLLTKMANKAMTDNTLSGRTMQGPLPCDWVGYSVSAHDVSVQPPNNRQIKFSYDGFRTIPRVYWDFLWFADTRAYSYLTGALRTFFNNQWATLGLIYAEYYHDGSVLGAYEKSMMTFNAYLCGIAASSSDPTAAAIWTNKLANLYAKSYVGGFYRDSATVTGTFVGAPSYFNSSWMLFHMLVKNGVFQNF